MTYTFPIKPIRKSWPRGERQWQLIQRNRRLKDRIRNSIIGLIAGDVLGVPVEFQPRALLDQHPVAEWREYGTHNQPMGSWSDDTSLMLCHLASITEQKILHPNNTAVKFLRWYDQGYMTSYGHRFDIGGTTQMALMRLKYGKHPGISGSTDSNSAGNGALMRILPVCLYLSMRTKTSRRWPYDRLMQMAGITHANPISQMACLFYFEMVHCMLQTRSQTEWARRVAAEILEPKMREWKVFTKFKRLCSKDFLKTKRKHIRSSGYVVDTLEAACWVAGRTSNCWDSLCEAVNLGDDTDTVGAVTGSLLGLTFQTWPCYPPLSVDNENRVENMIKDFQDVLGL